MKTSKHQSEDELDINEILSSMSQGTLNQMGARLNGIWSMEYGIGARVSHFGWSAETGQS